MKDTRESSYLGELTMAELREIYDSEPGIEESIREWIRESDSDFAAEQMDELKDVIRFEVDSWDNVYARPRQSTAYCGDMAEAVRKSIFGYPSTIEEALSKLERYQEGAERVGYPLPSHFEDAIEDQMQFVCDEYAKCIQADFHWWMEASSDDLFSSYFLDEVDRWVEDFPDLWEERLERIGRLERRKRERRTRRWKRRLFLFKRKPKRAMA